jgi:hypothetical protein
MTTYQEWKQKAEALSLDARVLTGRCSYRVEDRFSMTRYACLSHVEYANASVIALGVAARCLAAGCTKHHQ